MQVQMLVGAPATGLSAEAAAALPGPLAVLRDVVRTSGLRGLWLGQVATLVRETGGSGAWFLCKEYVAQRLLKRRGAAPGDDLAAWESAFSGACAGAMHEIAFYPADTIKSTMQTEEELRPELKGQKGRNFMVVGRELWRAQGLRGLYAGGGITIALSIPSSAVIFWIYDGLRKRFG